MDTPTSEADLLDIVADARRTGAQLTIVGGKTKRAIGHPNRVVSPVSMRRFAGIVEYDPAELAITVGAGTLLAEVQETLLEQRQMLAFEPWDHGPVYGEPAGAATIGGIVAARVAGPRRLSAGGTRDHVLGFRSVTGRGECFVGGGKVVKNVTGFDVAKLITGSWGQLAALTEVTLKVVPEPGDRITLRFAQVDVEDAVAAMATALGSPASVAAAAWTADQGLLIRLEGVPQAVSAGVATLVMLLGDLPDPHRLRNEEDHRAWNGIATASSCGASQALWRLVVPTSSGASALRALEGLGCAGFVVDWGGGLVWCAAPEDLDPERVHAIAAGLSGHAMLARGSAQLPAETPLLTEEASGAAWLSSRIKAGFDPDGVLDPWRFSGESR